MQHPDEGSRSPQKRLAAVCGLFCPACNIFIATTEDAERLEALARRYRLPAEQIKCYGCRSEKRFPFCETCTMYRCSVDKNIDFCVECADYPCAELKSFQQARPHRIELWQAQAEIQAAGFMQWFAAKLEHYSCPDCNTLNSAYDLSCRACRRTPSCRYVELHDAEIRAYLGR